MTVLDASSGTIDADAVQALLARARRDVDDGLLPSVQIALARHGELAAFETFGDATDDSRYTVFSSTKAFVAGAMWALIGDGLIDVSTRVAELVPEFGSNGKDVITIEQVMLHTSGFPHAPMRPQQGADPQARRARFAQWRLNWEPGSTFEYHPTSAHWVLAELIERVTGHDFRDVVEARVTTPAGLPRVLGLPLDAQAAVPGPDAQLVGSPASKEEMLAAFGVEALPVTEVTPEIVLNICRPESRTIGVPGGGGWMRASDLALCYQAMLHNPGGMWRDDVLHDATSNVRNSLGDRLTGVPASRGLGVVIAGDDGLAHLRGMGHTVSARAFGHNGAYGQIAWADPATGLSFGYCTNGLDLNDVRHPKRTTALSSLAAVCVR